MRFEIYTDVRGEWRWRLRSANGEAIAHGEGYHNRSDCLHAINLVKQCANTPIYQI